MIKVVDELELLQKDYNAAYVYLMDPLFFGNRNRVLAICDEINRRNLSIRWGCDAHIKLMTPEIVRAVAKANCYELSLGIESGVQRLLDEVNKGTTLKKAEEAVRMIRENSDIHLEGLFILGLPTETPQETLQTIRFAKSLPLDMAQFSILCPYPGSPLFLELTAKGELDSGVREGRFFGSPGMETLFVLHLLYRHGADLDTENHEFGTIAGFAEKGESQLFYAPFTDHQTASPFKSSQRS